jgi:hypothetical protein
MTLSYVRLAFVVSIALLARELSAQQEFYIDFDSVKDAYDADPSTPGLPPADEIYDYSPMQRMGILGYLNANYAPYGMLFLEGPKPHPLDDSSIVLNGGFGAGSEHVDFRNLDDDDSAAVNTISIFKFLGAPTWTDFDVAIGTANLVAHEAEHLMGVRHHDALGPIGMGLGGGIFPGDFLPTYPGPSGATETGISFSSLHAGGSLSFGSLIAPEFVSERAVVRTHMGGIAGPLFHTPEATTMNHSVESAKPVPTPAFSLPYPLRPPTPPGEPILVGIEGFAATVSGALDSDGAGGFLSDYYKFSGVEGQHWTIEAMSYILEGGDRYPDNADVGILILEPEFGAVLLYHSVTAINDDDDDGLLGSTLLDFILPYSGEYIIEVVAAGPFLGTGKTTFDGGSYELFLYTAERVSIPEPATLTSLSFAVVVLLSRRRNGKC